jgi:hypothetical protein
VYRQLRRGTEREQGYWAYLALRSAAYAEPGA